MIVEREKKYFARSLDSGTTSRADKEDELEATIARIKEGAEDTSRVPLIKKQPSASKGKVRPIHRIRLYDADTQAFRRVGCCKVLHRQEARPPAKGYSYRETRVGSGMST